MHKETRTPNENYILTHLPPEDYERMRPHLERVELHAGQILQEAGEVMDYVHFPKNSMISLISRTAAGESVEVGIVGCEGMECISAVLRVDRAPYVSLVQFPGGCERMRVQPLLDEFNRGGALHDLLLRYTQGLLLQTSQLAVCNRLHSISERLARWLLMSYDRCACVDLPYTHEFLSLMLGVRRAGVTEAALILHAEGYINYRRGQIQIVDREGLEDYTCDCYKVVKAEFDLLTA